MALYLHRNLKIHSHQKVTEFLASLEQVIGHLVAVALDQLTLVDLAYSFVLLGNSYCFIEVLDSLQNPAAMGFAS